MGAQTARKTRRPARKPEAKAAEQQTEPQKEQPQRGVHYAAVMQTDDGTRYAVASVGTQQIAEQAGQRWQDADLATFVGVIRVASGPEFVRLVS